MLRRKARRGRSRAIRSAGEGNVQKESQGRLEKSNAGGSCGDVGKGTQGSKARVCLRPGNRREPGGLDPKG